MKRIIWGLLIAAFLSLFLPQAESSNDTIIWNDPPPAVVVPPPAPEPFRPMIAIVIDDAGVNVKESARAVKNLTAPVTISYLAYARHIQGQVDDARAAGHEIILHLPMEADSEKVDPGPHHLSVHLPPEQIKKNLLKNLDAFTGYVGVNNHMGSKFSRDRQGLIIVMDELKKRGLFFLDSKTTPDSVIEEVAAEKSVPATHRDIFLDHDENTRDVNTSLQEVEAHALRRGSVIAIGHPKDITLSALESWLPTLEKKGFKLVPLSAVLKYREELKHVAGK